MALLGYAQSGSAVIVKSAGNSSIPVGAAVPSGESSSTNTISHAIPSTAAGVIVSRVTTDEDVGRQLTGLGLNNIAVFHQNDAYGKAGLDGVTLALAGRNLKPIATATVERNSVDVAQAVATLVAAKPQAIVQIGAYKACAAFIRAARAANYGGTFYNVSFVGTQALADELGKDGAGVVISQVVPNPFSTTKPLTREFLDAIAKGGNKVQPNFSSLEGYLAAKLLAEGVRRAGSRLTRETLITGLEAIGDTSFGGFSVSLGPDNHVASRFAELSMLTGDGKVRT